MSNHLLKLLFSTICGSIASTESGDNKAVLSLRNFLTNGLGSKIISMMSNDLDLSTVTNERELANVLTKIFPTERWESNSELSYLNGLSREDIKILYKRLWLLSPTQKEEDGRFHDEIKSQLDNPEADCDDNCLKDSEEYFTEELNKNNETSSLSSSQLAYHIIVILQKLVEVDNTSVLGQTDQNSVTMCCLNFSLDAISQNLQEQSFNENDQTVIIVKLMELMFKCFNNIVNRDGKSIEPVFKKLFKLLEISDDCELSCGLILTILTVLNNLCVKKSNQKLENLNIFILCNHLILKQMEILSNDKDLLHVIQIWLIKIIRNVKSAQRIRTHEKRKPKRKHLEESFCSHHDSLCDTCVFERLLIDSFGFIKSFSRLKQILDYFRFKGFCCCNGSIETIKAFMKPSVVSTQYLDVIQNQIIRPMFDKKVVCVHCNAKLNSASFKDEYFAILMYEIRKRQGWELHSLLHHVKVVQKMYSSDFLHKFVFNVIVPTFEYEKFKFLEQQNENMESTLIMTSCLSILKGSMKSESIINQFFTVRMINNIKDCSLIPEMAKSACQLIKLAFDNIKLIGVDEDQREKIAKLINNILFSNLLYLIRELTEIYEQVDLPRDVPLAKSNSVSQKSTDKTAEESDFEILDEKTVAVKEALSDMDVLLLNSIHWDILCDLISTNPDFRQDFVANIYNNFNGNILFTIAYNALDAILLKKELSSYQLRIISPQPKMANEVLPVLFERCDLLQPILISSYELNYDRVIGSFYHFHEINKSFLSKRKKSKREEFHLIYRLPRDNDTKFHALVTKDEFLTDNVCNDPLRKQQIADEEEHFLFHHSWLNQIRSGILDGKTIRDRLIKIVNRFVRTEEEFAAVHRANVIREITSPCGINYLSSVARNCFDICWRLSDSICFTAKMSTALEELKLLLLQDTWNEHQEAMIDALQLLLRVAEMKTRNFSRLDTENHLNCSTDSIFSDFNSSHERVAFTGSEDESLTDKKTETYYTADENYDGDEEYFSTTLDESSRSCYLPAFEFRNTNEHICKLVIEILMDLLRRCVEKSDQWEPSVLMTLAQRLSCMRTYLGGSEFLLKGFKAILQSNDERFITLQRTILELIEDLNTPGSFKALLSILTVNEAAIGLIISRIETLCVKEVPPRPFVKVTYPTFCSESLVTSTCDPHTHKLIQTIRDVQLSSKLLTPLTESSQIIPLNFLDFKLWNNQGFTISAWIEMTLTEDEKLSSHLVSVGSEKLMMAIYVNFDGSFSVNVIKPNQNLSDSSNKINRNLGEASKSSNKENINRTNIFGIGLASLRDSEASNIRTRSSLRKKTLYGEEETSKRLQTSKISVKSKRSKVKNDRWTHVCFSLRSNESEIMLLITVNGTEQELLEIPIDGMRESDINGMIQLLCIGSQKQLKDEPISLKYSISNVILFKIPLESPPHLFALGPDCDNLIDCEAMLIKPLMGILDFNKVTNKSKFIATSRETMLKMKMNILVVYSAGNSNRAIGYKDPDHGKPLEVFTIGNISEQIKVPSFARSIHLCGGLSSLLFLFARTIEMTDDPGTQSTALYIFLKMCYSNNHLYAEFEAKNLFNLVSHVFKHSNCYRGPGMLKAILDVIYGGTMFNRKSKSDDYQINEHSELNIQNPDLLLKLLENFSIFQSPDKSYTEVLNLLFKSLVTVVREKHPQRKQNLQCLTDYDFYAKLIDFCKTHLANSLSYTRISPTTAFFIIQLLKVLSKDSPVIWTIIEFQKLLLLLHHPSESFVTHDRTKFYFILPGNKPQKQSKSSLVSAKGSKYFNFSVKIRSTSVDPTSPTRVSTSPPRTPRTPSESISMFQEMSSSTRSTKSGIVATLPRKFKARKFDELTQIQTQSIVKAFHDTKTRKELKSPAKICLRRLHQAPKKSPFKTQKAPSKIKKVEDPHPMTRDDHNFIETMKTFMSTASVKSIVSEVEGDRYDVGISVLQENLLLMLKDSVLLLDDFKAEQDLSECLKIEMLIMFANHHDANVRAAIIELIHVLTSRESAENVIRFEKSNFWLHLGNQLTISKVNMRMAQACVDWICVEKVCIQDLSRGQNVHIKYKPAFSLIVAMIPSMVHDAQLIACTAKFLRFIFETNPDCFPTTILSGLISSSIKALMRLEPSQERAKESILMLLEQIATKCLTSSGSIQTLWDLLYGLSFVERQKKVAIVREVHVIILKQLISLCVVEQNRRGSRNSDSIKPTLAITQALGSLPSSEIKTRFNLMHDRSIQFICSWDVVDELSACEIELVKYLIQLHFYGIHQGSSLVLWGLNPAGAEEIKVFIVEILSSMLSQNSGYQIPGNDSKLIKSLLSQYLSSNQENFHDGCREVIAKFCGASVNEQQLNWNWSISAVEKIETIRQSSLKDQNAMIEKTVYKMEPVAQMLIESAMKLTRSVIDIQNKERRHLMNQLKKCQEIDFFRDWYDLIQRMVYEDSLWYNAELYPSTWELDGTEGPGRTRIRLKRTVLNIEERFFTDDSQTKASYQQRRPLLEYLMKPKETERYSIRDRIVFTFNAKHLTLELEIEGEIIITDNQLIFLANLDTYNNSIICDVKDIREIWDRRYQHKEIALEIFLATKNTFFIIFETNYERDIVRKFVSEKIDEKLSQKSDEIVQKWMENRLTNYEYLIALNKIGGRSYNDLMQYPVFPWIITDYENETLDLTVQSTFRKLGKTISTQHEEMEEHYISNYKYLAQSMSETQTMMKPYHYSSHYSNSGTVLHFLVRLPPFTSMFLLYQDHNFDIPDRTFHSIATTYRLTSKESATDVKELIPEFFYLSEFFNNNEGFNFGKRQSGEQVSDVKLPPWCEGSSRLFILVHRQALECDVVRKELNQWIDLIFGFKQRGNAAINAVNVFHTATYPEFQITNITDPVERSAYETMIRTYGQMPKQIFTTPHPHKKSSTTASNSSGCLPVLQTVKGLRWGIFTGSPQLVKPRRIDTLECRSKIARLVPNNETNIFYGLPEKSNLMGATKSGNHDLVLWGEHDGVIRVKSLKNPNEKTRKLFHTSSNDPVTACGSHVKHSNLWFGHESGNISVFVRTDKKIPVTRKKTNSRTFNSALEAIIGIKEVGMPNESDEDEPIVDSSWNFPVMLVKHKGEVLDLNICVEFNIVVSIGSDHRAVIWDAQKLEYIRTIESSCNTLKSQLKLVQVSPTLGDILTVFSPSLGIVDAKEEESFEISENSNVDDFINVSVAIAGKSQLRLHTINAKYINHTFADGFVTSVCFSFIKEGTGVNVIAVGFDDGVIRVYSTWTLEMIREIATGVNSEISQIMFTTNHHLTFLADQKIQLWESEGLDGDPPKFNSIVLY